jgi:hypothetical protein
MSDSTNPYAPPTNDEPAWPSGSLELAGFTYTPNDQLATALRWVIGISLALSAINIVSTSMTLDLFGRMQGGGAWSMAEAEANDLRAGLLALAYALTILTAGILWFVWQNRTSKNARALGAEGMEYGPNAWGWFFCPIFNLWRPLAVIRELWQATAPNEDLSDTLSTWKRAPTPEWLVLWWGAWVLGGVLSQASVRMTLNAQEISTHIFAGQLDILSDIVLIGGGVLAIRLVKQLHQRERERARLRGQRS